MWHSERLLFGQFGVWLLRLFNKNTFNELVVGDPPPHPLELKLRFFEGGVSTKIWLIAASMRCLLRLVGDSWLGLVGVGLLHWLVGIAS